MSFNACVNGFSLAQTHSSVFICPHLLSLPFNRTYT